MLESIDEFEDRPKSLRQARARNLRPWTRVRQGDARNGIAQISVETIDRAVR